MGGLLERLNSICGTLLVNPSIPVGLYSIHFHLRINDHGFKHTKPIHGVITGKCCPDAAGEAALGQQRPQEMRQERHEKLRQKMRQRP